MTYIWKGRVYRTQRDVAYAAGVHVNTVQRHLNEIGHLDYLGRSTRGRCLKFKMAGRDWSSIKQLADAAGVSYAAAWEWKTNHRHDLARHSLSKRQIA